MKNDKEPETFGSGSGSTHVYVVEAQSTYSDIVIDANPHLPLVLNTHEWKRVPVTCAPVGVPNRLEFWPEAVKHDFMTYQCAMAMACWLQASRRGIVTRLVQIEFSSSFSTKLLGRSEPLDLDKDDIALYHALKDKNRETAMERSK